uniref:Protein asunder n=1 Tax=Angiostrongylus cantonensis TaxID=6313 RepID=A0A0K0CZ89_ANGCA
MGIGPDHKVLVVLDHGPRFAKSSGNVGKCDKSLWTWCIEATLELHRTVSDLFPQEQGRSCSRLIRLVLVDYVGRVLQPHWGTELVTQQEVIISLLLISRLYSGAAISGVTLAIEALSQLSDAQMEQNRRETVSKRES